MLRQPTKLGKSSFHGITIVTTIENIINVCSKYDIPYINQNTGRGKTNFEFEFETMDGLRFTVYDWKEYRPLETNYEYKFHIGADNKMDSYEALGILKTELTYLQMETILEPLLTPEQIERKSITELKRVIATLDSKIKYVEKEPYMFDDNLLREYREEFIIWNDILNKIQKKYKKN